MVLWPQSHLLLQLLTAVVVGGPVGKRQWEQLQDSLPELWVVLPRDGGSSIPGHIQATSLKQVHLYSLPNSYFTQNIKGLILAAPSFCQ